MEFLLHSSKIALKIIMPKHDYSWLFRIWDFSLQKNRLFLTISIIFMMIEVSFDTLEPYAIGQLIKLMLIKDFNINKLSKYIFRIIFILFGNRFFEKLKDRFGNIFNNNFEKNLQHEYYKKLLEKDNEFFDKNKISNLFSVLSNDLTIICDITVFGFINLLKQLIQSLICILLLFIISKYLCIIISIFVPIIAILNSYKKNYILKKESQNEKEEKKSNNIVLEALENIKIIKSFSTEIKEKNKYENNLKKLFTIEKEIIFQCSLFEILIIIVLNFLIFLSVNYILYLTKGNSLEIDKFTSFFLYCKIIYNAFFNIIKFNRIFLKASVLSERFFYVLEYVPKIKTYESNNNKIEDKNIYKGNIKKKLSGNIELRNVNFEYDVINQKKSVILKNINLKINSGMSIGIVGLSGSGKTTLINLIQRLYDINDKKIINKICNEVYYNDEENESLLDYNKNNINFINEGDKDGIFYDGINVKNYDIKYFHNQIGFVQQEPSLFNGTIKENIIYGLDDENINISNKDYEKEIINALKISQADFVLDKKLFPLGLDSNVGERGSKLSGGQKQRISIARALIKKPKILILDEATSALDSESEFKFKKEIEKLKGEMTIIIISHRLITIKDCDQIIVINKGEIVEKGKHDDLYTNKGIYYNLMEKQIDE